MENLDKELKDIYNDNIKTSEKAEKQAEKEIITENERDEIVNQEQQIFSEENNNNNIEIENKINDDLPRGIKVSFKEEWQKVPQEFKSEIKRSFEQKDNYILKLEEQNNELNKAINTTEVDIQNVVKQTGLSREQVIGNMLSWVSACQNDPDNTLIMAIQQGNINLKNPMGLIRFIANKHRINLNEMSGIDPRQASLYDENLRLKLQQENYNKQLQYQEELKRYENERNIEKNIENFKNLHPEISNENFASQEFQLNMSYAIQKVLLKEPNNKDFLDILEKAYNIIDNKNLTTGLNSQTTTENQVEQNQVQAIKKPIATITKTTSIKSSSPVSRTVPKQYKNKREMELDLEKELKEIYNNK